MKRDTALFIITYLLIGILVSRGLLEVIVSKKIAMLLQLGFVQILISSLFFLSFPITVDRNLLYFILSCFCFLLVMVLSCLLTSLVQDFDQWYIYFYFTFYVIEIMIFSAIFSTQKSYAFPLVKVFFYFGWFLFIGAVLIQLGVLSLPGNSDVLFKNFRAASVTGSYLHYPIIMALVAFIMIETFFITRSKKYAFAGVVFSLAPFLVASRSGVFIVVFSYMLYFFIKGIQMLKYFLSKKTNSYLNSSIVYKGVSCLFVFFILFIIGLYTYHTYQENDVFRKFNKRFFMVTNSKAGGNEGRLRSWRRGLKIWTDSNMIIGENTGKVTNSTSSLFKGSSRIVESGLIQQLANFGFLGMVLYYGTFLWLFTYFQKGHYFLKAVYLASLTQTLFYQSLEVIPFITILVFLPWVSKNMNATINQHRFKYSVHFS